MSSLSSSVSAVLPAILGMALLIPFHTDAHMPSTASPEARARLCMSDEDRAAMLKRETELLGATHAARHASARDFACRVASGAAPLSSAPSTTVASVSAAPENEVGRWSEPFTVPVVGITAVLLHTGSVLFWSYDPAQYRNPANSNTGVAYLWDPKTRQGRSIAPPENIWCGGQTVLSDGRVYVAGGNLRYPEGPRGFAGSLSSYTFDPETEAWVRQPDMVNGRWYPTTTKLADDRVVITSGYDESGSQNLNQSVELFTPSATRDGVGSMQVVSSHYPTGLYPLQYLLPSGNVLQAGPDAHNSYMLLPGTSNNWTWSALPALRSSHHGYSNGVIYADSSVTPARQVVVVAGGTNNSGAIAANEWLDAYNPGGGWRFFPQWAQARQNANTVILPDGKLLTLGGNASNNDYGNPVFRSELYDRPADNPAGQWLTVAPHAVQAAYHSSALLLPDATVLLSQDDMDSTPAGAARHQVQIYSPPYLFKGTRPVIHGAPATIGLGQDMKLFLSTADIQSVALIAPGATTHANDMHQRMIKLKIKGLKYLWYGSDVTVTLPTSATLVPKGYYMLFVLNSRGVPSIAKFIRVI